MLKYNSIVDLKLCTFICFSYVMSWPSQAASRNRRPHSNDEHRACPTTPSSGTSTTSHQQPVQQNVIESTTTVDTPNQLLNQRHIAHPAPTMPPGPSDPEGSIPLDEAGGIGVRGTSSDSKTSTDNQSSILRQQIKPDNHDTTNRSSLPGYRRSTDVSTSSHSVTSETAMQTSSDTSGHGGARRKTPSSVPSSHLQTSIDTSQPQSSSHHGILSTQLQPPSHTYTTSSGGAVLQTLRDPTHYEELSVIGNGK